MSIDVLKTVALNWGKEYKDSFCPGEARFITGDQKLDAQFYHFENESGLLLKLTEDFETIIGYDIIDSEKFTWFMLKWS